jgi:hypothetical protein
MATTVARSHRDIIISNLHFKVPTQNQSGTGKTAYVDIDASTRQSPEFQLGDETLRVPFGARFPQGGEGGDVMNIELSLDDPEVLSFLTEWDNRCIQWIMDNPGFLGKKKISAEGAADAYTPLVKPSKSDPTKYAPLCRVKVNIGNDPKRRTDVFVADGAGGARVGSADDITPNSTVKAIISAGSIFFINRGFGVSLKAKKILVYPNTTKTDVGFRFGSDETTITTTGAAKQDVVHFDQSTVDTIPDETMREVDLADAM